MVHDSTISGNLLSVSETAEILNLSVALIRRYCSTGRLQGTKIGHDWVIPPSAIEAFRGRERPRGRPSEVNDGAAILNILDSPNLSPTVQTETDAKAMLGLIASGLIKIRNARDTSKRKKEISEQPLVPHPAQLVLGWSYLSAACIQEGLIQTQPVGIDELYTWCTKPLINWPVPKSLKERLDPESTFLDYRLINGEEKGITFWCEEWARSRLDLKSEFDEERIMPEIRLACRDHASGQAIYEHVRQFLIEHPVVSEAKLFDFCSNLPTPIVNLLTDSDGAYGLVPESLAYGAQIYVCPYCGSILTRVDGLIPSSSADCHQRRCQDRRKRPARTVSSLRPTYRLKNGIRRYVAEPGWAEIELKKNLERMGLQVQLWPQLDAYDLRITFSKTQEIWGVDVKDWSNPVALGVNIQNRTEGAFSLAPLWNRAFFVFPDDLKQRRPHYVTEFKGECYSKLRTERGQRIEPMFMRDFLLLARKQVKINHE